MRSEGAGVCDGADGARPVLPESIWHRMGDGAGAAKRYLRVPWHAVATFFAMRKFFKKFNHRGHGEHGVGGRREIKCETGRMDEAHCNAQEICAGAFESDSLTSKLAESPVSESPIRRANGPASSPVTSHSLQATTPEASLPATRYFQSAGLDLRPDGAGAPLAGVVVASEGGLCAGGFAGAFVFSEFADSAG